MGIFVPSNFSAFVSELYQFYNNLFSLTPYVHASKALPENKYCVKVSTSNFQGKKGVL